MELINLSSKLISFKSISPQSAGSIEFIEKILKKSNFKCKLLEFGSKKVKNLYAEISGGNGPNLYVTHYIHPCLLHYHWGGGEALAGAGGRGSASTGRTHSSMRRATPSRMVGTPSASGSNSVR